MSYKIREGLVCRDIAGVYFLIDIHDRHFYRNRQLNCLNPTAYLMISSMIGRGSFSAEDILADVVAGLDPQGGVPEERIRADIAKLLDVMVAKGWAENDEG